MTETNPQAALFAALSRAQAVAVSVEKDATNKFHKYNYASAEALIAEAKAALASAGLAVVPSSSMLREPKVFEREQGAFAVLLAEWVVVHGDGGSLPIACEWPVIPEKGRPLDKALAAARTASLGYLLRDLLQLPRVEEGTDLDHDSRDNQRQPQRHQPQARQLPPAMSEMKRRALLLASSIVNDLTASPADIAYATTEATNVCDDSPEGKGLRAGLDALIARKVSPDAAPSEMAAKMLQRMDALILEVKRD
jgi:hypothetical protein